jgi:hypothetical protein
MIDFVQRSGIAYAMVGLLTALPNTPLFQRLQSAGRLRVHKGPEGDHFGLTNIVTKLPHETLVNGYIHVLSTLYDPFVYFDRCKENLRHWQPPDGRMRPLTARDIWGGLQSLIRQGVTGSYRRAYWSHIKWVVETYPKKIGRALSQASVGHHYIMYTRDTVLPSLKRQHIGNPDEGLMPVQSKYSRGAAVSE